MPDTVTNLQDFFATLQTRFVAKEAAGVKGVYQFEISGDGGGDWWVEVDEGTMTVHAGRHDKPGVAYKVDAQNYLKILNGQMNGRLAVLTGKMKVSGSIPLAYKMQKFLPTN